MDLARGLRRLGAPPDGPRPALVRARREEGNQPQQRVACRDQPVQAALAQAQLAQKGVLLLRLHLRDLFLYFRADGEYLRTLGLRNLPHGLHVRGFLLADLAVGDVGRVDDRLVRQQEPARHDLALLLAHGKGARGLARLQMGAQPLAHVRLQRLELVAVLEQMARLLRAPLHGLQIRQHQLQVDHLDVAPGVDAAVHMDDVLILKTAHHVHDGVHLADVREELVAQPLAPAGALDQTRDVHKFHRRRRDLLGLIHPGQLVKPLVRHRHHAGVGLDGAEGIVGRLRARARDGVEQRALAYVGESHDSQLHLCPLPQYMRFPTGSIA